MSNWMNDTLAPGATIEVMRPTGLFVLHERDAPIVAFAGGSGITPVISIIKSALATTARPILLVYANRDAATRSSSRAELERLRVGVRRPALGASSPRLRSRLPRRRRSARRWWANTRDADVYICGPGPVHGHGRGRAVDARRRARPGLHRAVRRPRGRAGRRRDRRESPESLVIRLERRKHTVAYHAGDTVLETARRGGLRPPFSCEAGQLRDVHGPSRQGIGRDAREQRVVGRRGRATAGSSRASRSRRAPSWSSTTTRDRRAGAHRRQRPVLRARGTATRGTRASGRVTRCARRGRARTAARARRGR